MDRARQQPLNGKLSPLVIISSVVIIAIVVSLIMLDFGSPRIDRDDLQTDTVQQGDLTIQVNGNGVLLPKDIEWIASRVEGRVAAIHKRAGDIVAAGELLIELNNPALVTAAEEALSALEGAKAEKLSYSVDLENQLLNQKSISLQAKFAYESAKLKLDAETQLRKKSNIIADIDYQRTQLEVKQLLARYSIEQERLQKSQTNTAAQLAAKDAYIKQLSKALDRSNDKVSALAITASISGVLQSMNLEIGQRLLPGNEIAKVAQQDQLYAELKILARQATNIVLGQDVIIDTRNGTTTGHVSRIDPAVTQGSVIIDVTLNGELPKGARPELQVEGIITTAILRNILYVGKPSYSKTDSQISVYKIEGDYAQRLFIQTGQASMNNIQIISGLKAGDEIILSDSSDWQQHEKILIN
ncbi:efflux RND transporter periplasmic adaptor subunit [Oceanicoccus sp. KOV_DT_Chl]|uniref:efflux RND transporter periplasmic adaptor subunit n=1 Tax=Oceanicoccus sp. KOV_DT_Chl TaxID=1904639 RepID=UPI000C7C2AE4|nr:efflux RND transporter periplasmic adaptor subunit [Oceanicoccus sp. KOV_DT_Chl]